MNKAHIATRQKRGQELALRYKDKIVQRKDGIWLVLSSRSPRKRYEVDLSATDPSCSCADHQETGDKCKHHFAAVAIRDSRAAAIVPAPAPTPPRPTVQRNWSEYNEVQENEEDEFEPLLWQICQNVRQPEHQRGRPPNSGSDAAFAAVTKIYAQGRRVG